MIPLPAFETPYASALHRLLGKLARIDRLSAAELETLQLARLARLAEHAFAGSPFWRERLEAAGWTPGRRFDRDTLHRLPPLTRRELQTERIQTRPLDPRWGALIARASSGSTGQPVAVDWIATQKLLFDAFTIVNHLWHRRDFSLKLCVIRNSIKRTFRAANWGRPAGLMFRTGPCSGLSTADTDIASELEWLEAEKPDYLLTQPGRAAGLARHALARGRGGLRLRQLITMGEAVTAEDRQAVREAFGAEVKDIYSAKETGYLALQCPEHEHYHVTSAGALLEIVDAAGRPAAGGEPGDILVSVLDSFAMPLIRYQVGDVGAWGASCDCGRNLPVIARLLGRHRNLARLPGGRLRHVQFPGVEFLKIGPIREYRLVQRGESEFEVFVECAAPLDAQQKRHVVELVRGALDYPVQVAITEVERIDWGPGGKREEFVRLE